MSYLQKDRDLVQVGLGLRPAHLSVWPVRRLFRWECKEHVENSRSYEKNPNYQINDWEILYLVTDVDNSINACEFSTFSLKNRIKQGFGAGQILHGSGFGCLHFLAFLIEICISGFGPWVYLGLH